MYHALSLADLFTLIAVTGRQASRPVALLFPDQNSKSLKMLKGLQVPQSVAVTTLRTVVD